MLGRKAIPVSPENGFLTSTTTWLRAPIFGEYTNCDDPVLELVLSPHGNIISKVLRAIKTDKAINTYRLFRNS
jgi:hypothetical protein